MKLPNAGAAVVEKEKVVGYLLSATHRYRANKARFFMQFGFRADAWERLAYALLDQARRGEVMRTRQTGFGPRHEIDGKLSCLSGRADIRESRISWFGGVAGSCRMTVRLRLV
jgi:hypothetical protein